MVIRFLNDTQPAKLLIISAACIVLTAVFGVLAYKIDTGWNWNASIEQWSVTTTWDTSLSPRVIDQSTNPARAPFWKRTLPLLLNIFVFLLGVVSALLPMWAVGRLISDAIKEGHTHE